MSQPIDALIFDMDGTLWDAVDTYAAIWNAAIDSLAVQCSHVTYDDVVVLMGKPLDAIFQTLVGDACPNREAFMAELVRFQNELLPKMGGKLYPQVRETLARMKQRIPLFMISNCMQVGLDNFLDYTKLRPMFVDTLCYGSTGCDKDLNLIHLAERYSLKRPVYVGDIQRDADSTHAANMEFAWAAYGFGKVVDADFRIDTFNQLETLIENGKI